MAGAFELALNKNWKSNSKFAILVGDAPCHGNKYHNFKEFFPNGTPERRNIEDLINDLAGRNVSLFCMKITEFTNTMFSIFESIYNKYNKCQFRVVSMSSPQDLSDIVVNSAADVYINQRNKQI